MGAICPLLEIFPAVLKRYCLIMMSFCWVNFAVAAPQVLPLTEFYHDSLNKGQARLHQIQLEAASYSAMQGKAGLKPKLQLNAGIYENQYKSSDPVLAYQGDPFSDVSQCQNAANSGDCLSAILDGVSYQERDDRYRSQEWQLSLQQPLYDGAAYQQHKIASLEQDKIRLENQQMAAAQLFKVLELFLTGLELKIDIRFQQQYLKSLAQHVEDAQKVYASEGEFENLVHQARLSHEKAELELVSRQMDFSYWQRQVFALSAGVSLYLPELITPASAKPYKKLNKNQDKSQGNMALISEAWFEQAQYFLQTTALSNYSLDQLIHQANADNIDVKLSALKQEQAERLLKQAKSEHLPKVSMVAVHRDRRLDSGEGFVPGASESAVGIDFSLPLYSGGLLSQQRKERAALALAAKEEKDWRLYKLQQSMQSRWQQLQVMQGQSAQLKKLQQHQRATLSFFQRSVSAGEAKQQAWLEAYQQLQQINHKRFALFKDLLLLDARLQQDAGILQAGYLDSLQSLFDRPVNPLDVSNEGG